MDYAEALHGVKKGRVDDAIMSICTSLIGKGFSFRQAEAILELAKERLKDARI